MNKKLFGASFMRHMKGFTRQCDMYAVIECTCTHGNFDCDSRGLSSPRHRQGVDTLSSRN